MPCEECSIGPVGALRTDADNSGHGLARGVWNGRVGYTGGEQRRAGGAISGRDVPMSTAESQTPHADTPPARMTYQQFMDWADEDTLAEWVDGEVIMTSPASLPHQD